MRKLIRDKYRAHMDRRRRREGAWTPAAIAAACALYFGGGLLIGFLLNPGWFLAVWIALGPLTIALAGYSQRSETT